MNRLRCLMLLAAPLLVVAEPVPSGEFANERLELPPFTVLGKIELPKPESWLYARIDGFEVLTNASPKESNRLLKDFQMFRQALQIVRPAPVLPLAASSLILCGRGNGFRAFTAEGLPDFEGDITRMLRDREQAAVVVDLETRTIGNSNPPNYLEPDRHLYREYVRFLVSQGDAPVPYWLVEGTAQIVMDMKFRPRTIKFGRIDNTNGAPIDVSPAADDVTGASTGMEAGTMLRTMASDGAASLPDVVSGIGFYRPFTITLADRRLVPLDRFLAVGSSDPEVSDPFQDGLWVKQAYAFVHMCQFRFDGKFKAPFETFVRRLASEPLSEPLFVACFGLTYQEMLDELYRYVRYPRHRYRDIKLAEGSELSAEDVVFREATQSEVARIKGDAQRLAGRSEDALFTYRVAYARGERDPALLGSLGLAENHAGQAERARQFLEAAAKLGNDRPSVWATLARLRLDEAKVKPAADGKLSAEQTVAVFAPLLHARSLKPALPETYQVMAEAWELSAVAPTPANIHVLGEGVTLFPSDAELILRTAHLYLRSGDPQSAAEVARMGLRFAADDAIRNRFNAFLAGLAKSPTDS